MAWPRPRRRPRRLSSMVGTASWTGRFPRRSAGPAGNGQPTGRAPGCCPHLAGPGASDLPALLDEVGHGQTAADLASAIEHISARRQAALERAGASAHAADEGALVGRGCLQPTGSSGSRGNSRHRIGPLRRSRRLPPTRVASVRSRTRHSPTSPGCGRPSRVEQGPRMPWPKPEHVPPPKPPPGSGRAAARCRRGAAAREAAARAAAEAAARRQRPGTPLPRRPLEAARGPRGPGRWRCPRHGHPVAACRRRRPGHCSVDARCVWIRRRSVGLPGLPVDRGRAAGTGPPAIRRPGPTGSRNPPRHPRCRVPVRTGSPTRPRRSPGGWATSKAATGPLAQPSPSGRATHHTGTDRLPSDGPTVRDESADTPGSVLPTVTGDEATVIHLRAPLPTPSSALPGCSGRPP